jgi:RluA family pseudouridine synthase
VLLRTDAVLILDKPAGLPVHAARAGVPSVAAALPSLRFGKRRDPQPAHRLDADTSGCLALGRTAPALAELNRLFAERRIAKTYWAVVRGAPLGESGAIAWPLRKTSTARTGWRMEAHPQGEAALTRWRVLGRGAGLCWLELAPETGRTHQLRVHCAASGWPILGDPLYGTGGGALHLLARAIALPLAPPLAATAPMPEALAPAFSACGWRGD